MFAAVMEAALPSSDETSAAVVPLVNLVVQSGRIIVQGLVQALLGISPMTKVRLLWASRSIFGLNANQLKLEANGKPPPLALAWLQSPIAGCSQAQASVVRSGREDREKGVARFDRFARHKLLP